MHMLSANVESQMLMLTDIVPRQYADEMSALSVGRLPLVLILLDTIHLVQSTVSLEQDSGDMVP